MSHLNVISPTIITEVDYETTVRGLINKLAVKKPIKEIEYEAKVRNIIIKLALIKPLVTYNENRKIQLVENLLKEYGII